MNKDQFHQEYTATSTSSCCDSTCCSDTEEISEATAAQVVEQEPDEIKGLVREYYAKRATGATSGCGCGCNSAEDFDRISAALGYSPEELASVPEGANLGLGCGNPTAIDLIPAGATVLDLGSGGGFDCFLAARQAGPEGFVIGVDMTPEMIDRARANTRKAGIKNVEFRLGEIEALPVADSSVDVIISNCVINLSPDKPRVFAEAFRVLKPGGKLMVSDPVLTRKLPHSVMRSAEAYAECVAGAELKDRYLQIIEEAGFTQIRVTSERDPLSPLVDEEKWDRIPENIQEETFKALADEAPVVSINVYAIKPG